MRTDIQPVCDSCGKNTKVNVERIQSLSDDFTFEVGYHCEHCNKWYLAYFDNEQLAEERGKLELLRKLVARDPKDPRARRKYNKASVRFQNQFDDFQRDQKSRRGLPVGGST